MLKNFAKKIFSFIKLWWLDIKKGGQEWLWLLPIPFIILVFFNSQYASLGSLQLHSLDDYVFQGSLIYMYQGLKHLHLSSLFGYGFYAYGFSYFLLNLIIVLPFLIWHNSFLLIFLPRMLTGMFALLALVYFYKFCRLYTNRLSASLLILLPLLAPAFWVNANWFHPDWMMAFFLTMSVYFFAKDENKFGEYFSLAIISFGFAVGIKYQALTFLSLPIFYILFDKRMLSGAAVIRKRVVMSLQSVLAILGLFLLNNPYILHPLGWRAFWNALVGNLQSNAVNNGSVVNPTVWQKVSEVILPSFFNPILLLLVVLGAGYCIYFYLKRNDFRLFAVLALSVCINVLYLFFFVNKAWDQYYLAPLFLSCLFLLPLLIKLDWKKTAAVLLALAILQVGFIGKNIPNLVLASHDRNAPGFNNFTSSQNVEFNNFLLSELKGKVNPQTNIAISPFTLFDFESLGLGFNNIYPIFGPFPEDMISREKYIEGQRAYWGNQKSDQDLGKYFVEKDFIIFRKNEAYFDPAQLAEERDKAAYEQSLQLIESMEKGAYGYILMAQNPEGYIFQKVK